MRSFEPNTPLGSTKCHCIWLPVRFAKLHPARPFFSLVVYPSALASDSAIVLHILSVVYRVSREYLAGSSLLHSASAYLMHKQLLPSGFHKKSTKANNSPGLRADNSCLVEWDRRPSPSAFFQTGFVLCMAISTEVRIDLGIAGIPSWAVQWTGKPQIFLLLKWILCLCLFFNYLKTSLDLSETDLQLHYTPGSVRCNTAKKNLLVDYTDFS